MTPHKCPVCDGTGLVSRPPGIASDQMTWVDSGKAPYGCRPCQGSGIIWIDTLTSWLKVTSWTPNVTIQVRA